MDERKRKILEMLEEGHITAEEAESLLEALEDQKGDHRQSEKRHSHTTEKEQTERSGPSFQESVKSFTEGLFNIIDDTIQKVKDVPFEFNSPHVAVKRDFYFSSDDLRFLSVDLNNGSIKLMPSEDSTVHVELNGKVYREKDEFTAESLFDKYVTAEKNNGTLQIEQDRKHISVGVVIYLPRKEYEQAYLKSTNGSITIHDCEIKIARISSMNGSVKLNKYSGDALYAVTKHGSVRLDEIEVSKVKAETTTGSLYVDGVMEHINGDVVTGSVRVFIRNEDAVRADLKATTGSIQVYVPREISINGSAQSSIGSVDINLPNVLQNHIENETLRKHIEFFSATEETDYLEIDLSTKTGSIRVYKLS